MIERLSIRRFKSIDSLDLTCRKVNLFIGEPDTGKTNILDALRLLSFLGWSHPVGTSLRLSPPVFFTDLFFRQFHQPPIKVKIDSLAVSFDLRSPGEMAAQVNIPDRGGSHFMVGFSGTNSRPEFRFIRSYEYAPASAWQYSAANEDQRAMVGIPHGSNLLYLLRHNQALYDELRDYIEPLGFRPHFDLTQNRFLLSQVREDGVFDYSLDILSDSIKRLLFYTAILMTSRKVTLVLDEPDVMAFPPYPKTLGETIAFDETNQFFLTTHNPYFLSAIIEKTSQEDLAVFVTHRTQGGATSAQPLGSEQVERLISLGSNAFFNLDQILNPASQPSSHEPKRRL